MTIMVCGASEKLQQQDHERRQRYQRCKTGVCLPERITAALTTSPAHPAHMKHANIPRAAVNASVYSLCHPAACTWQPACQDPRAGRSSHRGPGLDEDLHSLFSGSTNFLRCSGYWFSYCRWSGVPLPKGQRSHLGRSSHTFACHIDGKACKRQISFADHGCYSYDIEVRATRGIVRASP